MSLSATLSGAHVCVCVGAGGVGKTTTAAATALGLAAEGRRVAVVTIDPAQRLADALGLERLENEPLRVDAHAFAAAGLPVDGELWAMTLDAKRTFDAVIEQLAPDEATRDAIVGNRIYRELSTAVAGSQEFGAVSKLYELERSGRFDCIVLDTPPSRNALDFLDAPGHLGPFLQHRVMRALTAPTGFMLGALRRLTGATLLRDLAELFGALEAVTDGLAHQASQVERLLREPSTAFVLVTSAERLSVDEAVHLSRRLALNGNRLSALVVNRFHARTRSHARNDAAGLNGALADKALLALQELRALAARDAAGVGRLAAEIAAGDPVLVPDFEQAVHDAEGLVLMHRHLFASAGEAVGLLEQRAF